MCMHAHGVKNILMSLWPVKLHRSTHRSVPTRPQGDAVNPNLKKPGGKEICKHILMTEWDPSQAAAIFSCSCTPDQTADQARELERVCEDKMRRDVPFPSPHVVTENAMTQSAASRAAEALGSNWKLCPVDYSYFSSRS